MGNLKPFLYLANGTTDIQYSVVVPNSNHYQIANTGNAPNCGRSVCNLEFNYDPSSNTGDNLHTFSGRGITGNGKSCLIEMKDPSGRVKGKMALLAHRNRLETHPISDLEYKPHIYLVSLDGLINKEYRLSIMMKIKGYKTHKFHHIGNQPENLGNSESLNSILTIEGSLSGDVAWETFHFPIVFKESRDDNSLSVINVLDGMGNMKGKGIVKYGDADEQPTV